VELPVPASGAAPLRQERPSIRELLDAVLVLVGDEDVAAPIHRNGSRNVELPITVAGAAPLRNEGTRVLLAHALAGSSPRALPADLSARRARPTARGRRRNGAGGVRVDALARVST